jgi:hypothetical protein
MPDMTKRTYSHQLGAVNGVLVALITLSVGMVALGGLAAWAYVNYADQKSNVDARVDRAVAKAEKVQAEEDETKFAEREKEPNREFAGPSDYGRLSFMYPKTWSVYVDSDGSKGGDYEAYLNPVTVPSVKSEARYALHITISEDSYEDVVSSYEGVVEKGDLKSSATSANGQNGTRLDGNFTKDIRGAAVIYKIRDKTAIIQTDADTFKPDFEKIIKTISFNQ